MLFYLITATGVKGEGTRPFRILQVGGKYILLMNFSMVMGVWNYYLKIIQITKDVSLNGTGGYRITLKVNKDEIWAITII